MTAENDGSRFDQVPATAATRTVPERPTRREILSYFDHRFGMDESVFEDISFWEKGKGKIWAFRGELASPVRVETLGLHLLRTRQRHWKPTTDGMQVFGRHATENCITLARDKSRAFWRGEAQPIDWDGPAGYLIVAHEFGGRVEPLGVGLYKQGELRSQIPKSRQRDIDSTE